jgi:WD40 repeat protein
MDHTRPSNEISALFSPDGNRIVTASNDNTARIWDKEKASVEGHGAKDLFVLGCEFPKASRLEDRWLMSRNNMTVLLKVFRDGAKVAPHTVEGDKNKHEELAANVVAEVEPRLHPYSVTGRQRCPAYLPFKANSPYPSTIANGKTPCDRS